ncbi:MAG TPA: ribosome biogenesis/translation initiation ATPase RLI [Candidatus Nanoarchaeia archaeon]|nr:ribosome biogenesis/translation initiation ATPase RLI [Candidatus Nanoarchaeia archaeon]
MKRIAIVNNDKLKDMDRKKYIQSICPVNRSGTECIYFDGPKLLIDEVSCIGCGICANAAPESIQIINLPEKLTTNPIHRFGLNKFLLYSLPTPVFGQVVGIIGKNGIGKSTALKILAGILKPNFGTEKEADYDELIKRFKGSEAQSFFEKIKKGEIKISYKPQAVDLLPNQYKGTVVDLLKKVDEKGIAEEIIKKFQLEPVRDRQMKDLSGGELQRLAIAATFLKKANFYVFDEPTSYLDIKQRLMVAAAIKELATPDVAVMVIEHDLIILDHMADLIQIMYGQQAAWGTVSQPRATRIGINTYLSGFLREENIRFREKEIKFSSKPPMDSGKVIPIFDWNTMQKKLGSFSLTVQPGSLNLNEIVGMVGENGIGKTTFVKLIAGTLQPDEGNQIDKMKVAYKPQYLAPTDELVMTFLDETIKKHNTELIEPLNIETLFMNRLDELSGGELQRVMIAKALGEESDLILLDEPSAHLDVEQRLITSKIIRDIVEKYNKTCLIVDHDLLFIDYLSDRLVVCEGTPAVHGIVEGPFTMLKGMNTFLGNLQITMRRDLESNRPRINKKDSQMERQQISEGKLYYS